MLVCTYYKKILVFSKKIFQNTLHSDLITVIFIPGFLSIDIGTYLTTVKVWSKLYLSTLEMSVIVNWFHSVDIWKGHRIIFFQIRRFFLIIDRSSGFYSASREFGATDRDDYYLA